MPLPLNALIIWRTTDENTPIANIEVFCCERCGSVVLKENAEQHDKWHFHMIAPLADYPGLRVRDARTDT